MVSKKHLSKAKKKLTMPELRSVVLNITEQYGVTNVRIFGSYARDEQTEKSDVDLLVDFPEEMSLLDISGLKLDLEDALQKKVDVVGAKNIKPRLKKYILPEAKLL